MLHASENVLRHEVEEVRRKNKRRNRAGLIIGAVGATLLIPAGAWAFITLTGTGEVEAKVGEVKQLTVSDARFTNDLYPGFSTDVSFKVANPNPFPVKVTDIAATSASGFAGGGCPNGANLSGFASALNVNKPLGDAAKIVTAGGTATITIPKAVTLAEQATGPCGFKVGIKITGAQQAQQPAAAENG